MASISSETGLPSGWEVRHSNSKNLPYYFDTQTKESRWEPPTGTDPQLIKAYMARHHSSSAGLSSSNKPTASSTMVSDGGAPSSAASTAPEGKIRAAHLLVKHSGSRRPSSWKEESITRSKAEAIQILQDHESKIRSGSVTLGDLATSESDCSSARKKGDLGFFGRGDMQKEFEEAAFALQPGQMSGIVDSASGVHLIERLQ